jgi:hypothetical protein
MDDADPTAIAFIRQVACNCKKLAKDCTDERIDAAFEEYYSIESALLDPSLDWEDPWSAYAHRVRFVNHELLSSNEGAVLGRRLDAVAALLVSSFGEFIPSVDGLARHGPGAVSDMPQDRIKWSFPTWPQKLASLFIEEDTTGIPRERSTDPIAMSSLFYVPKTAKGPRLIASEPIANQWIQQKVFSFLCDLANGSLVHAFFNHRDQTLSQKLVMKASIDRSLATIDLSSASDRLACWHIERLFGANASILSALIACRTSTVHDRRHGDVIGIRKFAAMGSALTFPIQSIFFLTVALAALGCESRRDILAMRGKVRVFGDDIIVPNDGYVSVVNALETLGLKVNRSKSFSKGFFRESCGMDAFKGHDVTPVKSKHYQPHAATTVEAVRDTANLLFAKGYWKYAERLDTKLKPFLRAQPVAALKPEEESGRATPRGSSVGLWSFSGARLDHLKMRWHKSLHRYEYYFKRVRTKVRYREVDGDSALSMFWNSAWRYDMPRSLRAYKGSTSFIEAGWVPDHLLAKAGREPSMYAQ